MSLYKFPLKPFLDAIYVDKDKFGFNEESADKFNFAIIKKTEGNITYEEFWILSNCYYDYDIEKFKSVNNEKTCFGIQIQANGTYPGEVGTDNNNVGINVWRHAANNSTQWDTFDTMNGWYNAFMLDSYGGMTIGGAGFEVDGNGIFPYTRLTSSGYKDSNDNEYYLLGLLDNAYHPTTYDSWQMDDNSTYAWFFGFRTPKKPNEGNSPLKNNTNTEFVIMYNDTPFTTINNKHKLDIDKWHTVFSANIDGVKTINKLQDNYKGKNVVIDAVTGDITFEEKNNHQHSEYVNPTIADDLTTNDSTKVLSAKQGYNLQQDKLNNKFKDANKKGKNLVTDSSTGEVIFEAKNNHQHSEYVNPTIADNLTTNDSTKVLSAKQGYNLEQNKEDKSNIQFFTQNLDSSANATGTIEYKKWHKMVICDINITPANIQNVNGQDVIKLAHIPQSFKPNSTYTEYNCNNAIFSTNMNSRGVFALDFNTSMNSFLVVVQGFSFSLNEEIKGQLMWFTD